jgi:alpha-glucosidase
MITPTPFPDSPAANAWWQGGVLYQIYVRSFADSNGDGIGDIPGLIGRLDHLEWLGVDGIWLSPTMPSPNADWGYDVADYRDVHPELGTLADLDRLIAEAGRRGIRVLLDLVPNHTSDRHAWFKDARSSRDSAHRDWYVWADSRRDGSPPNDWASVFDGPAWTFDRETGQWYLHQFLAEQPDLNWWSDEVRDAFDDVLRFWFARGVAGFRIDVAHSIVKDPELLTLDTHPGVHDVLRRWRALADSQEPGRVLLGETHVRELELMATFYGKGEDELHLAFNFPFVYADFGPGLADVVAETEALIPETAWPVWTGSNHDAGRFPTRWCDGDDARTRLALIALVTLRGTPVLYYGDEIGMTEVELRPEQLRDPVGLRRWPEDHGRDPMRTPMQWSAAEGAGFSDPRSVPWLPLGDHRARNVEDQRDDPESLLSFSRELIMARRRSADLRSGAYRPVASPPGIWAWRRGSRTTVALNLSADEASIQEVDGTVTVSTSPGRKGEQLGGTASLDPWEGIVVENGSATL